MGEFFPPDRLETDRVLLRSYLPGDGALLQEAKAGSYAHLRPWMPWAREDETAEADEARARRFRADYLTNTAWVIGIFSLDGSRLLGGTDFRPDGPVEGWSGEIGMWIRAEEAGAGLGTQVLRTMLRWGLTDWPFQRLMWQCDVRNAASVRVAEKAGMSPEGTRRADHNPVDGGRRDVRVFAALRSDLRVDGTLQPAAGPP